MDDRTVDNGNAHQHTNNAVILYVASADDQNMKTIEANQGFYPSPLSITILIHDKYVHILLYYLL